MHTRRPVVMSQSPVSPQLYLPQAAPSGCVHSKLVMVQPVGHMHCSLHTRMPEPSLLLQGIVLPCMHSREPRHISS
jgi:hypothetical protein